MGARIRKYTYRILPYTQENIERYKSKDNMLRHARCDDSSFGQFYVNKKSGRMVGYVGCEGDTIVALEVSDGFQGRGYSSRLIMYALRNGAYKLSVNKSNEHAIDVYKHMGFEVYDEDRNMLYMQKSPK